VPGASEEIVVASLRRSGGCVSLGVEERTSPGTTPRTTTVDAAPTTVGKGDRDMGTHGLGLKRRSAVGIAAVALLCAACSAGGGESNATTSPTTPAVTGAGDASTSSPRLIVVDADAGERCDRFGYPCNWADANDATFQRSLDLLDATVAILSEDRDLEELVFEATGMLLAEPDVAEVHPQLDTLSSIVFRVEGAPEVLALTEVAELAGEAAPGIERGEAIAAEIVEEIDGRHSGPADPSDETIENEEIDGEAIGDAIIGDQMDEDFIVDLVSFDPTHRPLREPRTALVIDPFAGANPTLWAEGAAIAAIFSGGGFSVEHMTSDVTWESLLSIGSFDAVHVNSHGETWCPRGADGQRQFSGERCRSGFMLGIADSSQSELPDGVSVSRGRSSEDGEYHYWVYDRFFEQVTFGQNLTDTVIMLSSCEGAGLREGYDSGEDVESPFRTSMMSQFGSVLAWDQEVRRESAAAASTVFWTLMVDEGVDAQVAYRAMQQGGVAQDGEDDLIVDLIRRYNRSFPRASLQFGGGDKRVRDVIETQQGGIEIVDDGDIEVIGVLGDGNNEKIEEIQFLVEGVEEGTEGSVEIEVRLDGRKLPETINLMGNAARIGGGQGYGHWLVNVTDFDIGRDLVPSDVDPADPTDFRWEARVSDDGFGRWSAHEAEPVHFVIDIEAKGPLPIFTDLGNQLPPNATLEGNELLLRFSTAGGSAGGQFEATIVESTIGEVATWFASLSGEYDPEGGTMGGQAKVAAAGGVLGISFGQFDGDGTWEGRVDYAARTVTGVVRAGDGSQPFTATF
jgi:hypothetical protein